MSYVGEQRGIRLLIIKGQSLAHHGLRPDRTSADVDVLVEPRLFDELCGQIRGAGWRKRATTEVGAVWAGHSLTFLSDSWPCDIDVHRYFPGFLNDPATTFDLLWDSRTRMDLAHRSVVIPGRVASILIAGLHQLRDGETRADKLELANLTNADLSDEERADLLALAESTGALEPARGLLETFGVRADKLPPPRDSPALRAWRARVDARASGAFFWILLMERTPASKRFGVLRRALWPPRETLLINHPGTHDTLLNRTKLRLARLPGGLRGLWPAALAYVNRRRQGPS
ncbi:MAG: hypothetical protein ABWX92_07770 [Mycetocola sp.]